MSTQAAAGDRYKTLAANTALISFGTLGSKLMVFFMVRFYTGYMSPADYGTADIITQTANLLVPLVSFGMAEAVFRFAAGRPSERREVFTAGILCTAAGLALLAAFLPLLRRTELIGCHGLLLTVYVAASCLHSMCAQYVRALGDTPGYTLQGLINTALVIGFNILLLAVFRLGMTGYVLSVAAADTGCSLWLIVRKRLWNELSLHIGKPLFIRLISYSVPLIPTSVFWWITGVSDRYMISGFLGSAANGIYAVSGKIPTMLTILSTVFMDAWQLSAVLDADSGQTALRQFYSHVWAVFQAAVFVCVSCMIAASRAGIRLLADAEYFEAWRCVPVLTLAMVCSALSSFLGSVYGRYICQPYGLPHGNGGRGNEHSAQSAAHSLPGRYSGRGSRNFHKLPRSFSYPRRERAATHFFRSLPAPLRRGSAHYRRSGRLHGRAVAAAICRTGRGSRGCLIHKPRSAQAMYG